MLGGMGPLLFSYGGFDHKSPSAPTADLQDRASRSDESYHCVHAHVAQALDLERALREPSSAGTCQRCLSDLSKLEPCDNVNRNVSRCVCVWVVDRRSAHICSVDMVPAPSRSAVSCLNGA
eukprot:6438239-Amphidinium_carterae.1